MRCMATNIPQDDFHKTGLRLPKDLHERLHEAAAASGRSYNGEIVNRLEGSFTPTADAAELEQARATIASLNRALEQEQYRRALEAASDINLADLILALYDALPAARKADPRFKSEVEFAEVQLYDRLATMIEAGREKEAFAELDFVSVARAKAAALARLETRRVLLAELAKERRDQVPAQVATGKQDALEQQSSEAQARHVEQTTATARAALKNRKRR